MSDALALLPLGPAVLFGAGAAWAAWSDPGISITWWQRPPLLGGVAAVLAGLSVLLLAAAP